MDGIHLVAAATLRVFSEQEVHTQAQPPTEAGIRHQHDPVEQAVRPAEGRLPHLSGDVAKAVEQGREAGVVSGPRP